MIMIIPLINKTLIVSKVWKQQGPLRLLQERLRWFRHTDSTDTLTGRYVPLPNDTRHKDYSCSYLTEKTGHILQLGACTEGGGEEIRRRMARCEQQ